MNVKHLAAVAALACVLGVSADEVQFSEVPKPVQTTINRSLDGGVVKKIDEDRREGRTVYDVSVRKDGTDKRVRIDADGKLLKDPINISDDKTDGNVSGLITPHTSDEKVLKVDANGAINEPKALAEVNRRPDAKRKIFHKGDGKLLGFIPWKKQTHDVEVNANTEATAVGAPAPSSTGSSHEH
jgi:hypothetical protein